MTTTTYPELQEKIAATLGSEMVWKAYGTGPFGRPFFIRFGTPATYSRTNVRAIAEAIFARHPARPALMRICRDDKIKGPWVNTGKFVGTQPVGENYGE